MKYEKSEVGSLVVYHPIYIVHWVPRESKYSLYEEKF